ncbi:MAG: hypothetical protein NC218_08380 [Acetobacter sp.]|nr:hypothetical protein [Acetobacter sp.]
MAYNPNDNSFGVQLATKMQLILDQPMSDMMTGLTNQDYEGEFFKIGDTVQIVKPDANSVNVSVGQPITPDGERETFTLDAQGLSNNPVDDPANLAHGVNDARLQVRDLTFTKNELKIDRVSKYAFAVSDFTDAMGKWNYESGGLELAAHRLRKAHNAEIATAAASDAGVAQSQNADGLDALLGTGSAPVAIANADDLYENVILPMFARLYDKGAITADGQVPFGSNPVEGKSTYGKIYMDTQLYTMLLKSKYFTDRATEGADEKVKTGKVKTITGLDVAIEPSLRTVGTAAEAADGKRIHIEGVAAGVHVIVAGTKNAITRAGKVLPPTSFKSHTRFATEYHGCELYGQKVFEPDALAVAYITIA